jgi:hypothetical protein
MLLIWAFSLNSLDGGKVLLSVERTSMFSPGISLSFIAKLLFSILISPF